MARSSAYWTVCSLDIVGKMARAALLLGALLSPAAALKSHVEHHPSHHHHHHHHDEDGESADDAPVEWHAVPNPLSNTLLVIHCERHDQICEERWPLFEGYKAYFGKVRYLAHGDCETDKSLCLMDIMEKEAEGFDGLFYMHFDIILSPCRLAKVFNKDSLGWFAMPADNTIDEEGKKLIPGSVKDKTIFGVEWTPKVWNKYDTAIQAIRKMSPKLTALDNKKVYTSENDLFYIPKAAFKRYGDLSDEFAFQGLWHEIAGPTTRKIIEENFNVSSVDFGCKGACCENLDTWDLHDTEFRCGHRFDLREEHIQKALKKVVNESAADCTW